MITKKQLEKEIEEICIDKENLKPLQATLTQTNEIIEMIEELEDEDSGDIILFKKSLLTKIKEEKNERTK